MILPPGWYLEMPPNDWLRLVCRDLSADEPGALIDDVYQTKDVAVKFQREGDEFKGFAALKKVPKSGQVNGCVVQRMGPRRTATTEAVEAIVHAIRTARASRKG